MNTIFFVTCTNKQVPSCDEKFSSQLGTCLNYAAAGGARWCPPEVQDAGGVPLFEVRKWFY